MLHLFVTVQYITLKKLYWFAMFVRDRAQWDHAESVKPTADDEKLQAWLEKTENSKDSSHQALYGPSDWCYLQKALMESLNKQLSFENVFIWIFFFFFLVSF